MTKKLSAAKAKKMLRDDSAHGKPLNKAQKGLFGVVASGKKPKKKGFSNQTAEYEGI